MSHFPPKHPLTYIEKVKTGHSFLLTHHVSRTTLSIIHPNQSIGLLAQTGSYKLPSLPICLHCTAHQMHKSRWRRAHAQAAHKTAKHGRAAQRGSEPGRDHAPAP